MTGDCNAETRVERPPDGYRAQVVTTDSAFVMAIPGARCTCSRCGYDLVERQSACSECGAPQDERVFSIPVWEVIPPATIADRVKGCVSAFLLCAITVLVGVSIVELTTPRGISKTLFCAAPLVVLGLVAGAIATMRLVMRSEIDDPTGATDRLHFTSGALSATSVEGANADFDVELPWSAVTSVRADATSRAELTVISIMCDSADRSSPDTVDQESCVFRFVVGGGRCNAELVVHALSELARRARAASSEVPAPNTCLSAERRTRRSRSRRLP